MPMTKWTEAGLMVIRLVVECLGVTSQLVVTWLQVASWLRQMVQVMVLVMDVTAAAAAVTTARAAVGGCCRTRTVAAAAGIDVVADEQLMVI
jgi:hypothetical protein